MVPNRGYYRQRLLIQWDINTNVPFFFNNGLLNNFINIKITWFDERHLWIDSNGDQPTDYVLCLTFELIDEL